MVFHWQYLHQFCRDVFRSLGIPDEDAQTAASVLSLADCRGIDSHGVARLHSYVGLLQEGRINTHSVLRVVSEKKSVCTVDGDNGLGLVIGPKANQIAIEKAKQYGSGWVSVRNSNHFGIGAYYSLEALQHDVLGLSMTNTTKLVAPIWGRERMLGTNPLSIAFPGLQEPPIVIDMATSATAYGKIEMANRLNEPLPEGWIIDHEGKSSTQPTDMIAGGALLPLGSTREMGGHKGYALAAMVDILSAVLSGANWGPFAPPFALRQEIPERSVGKGIGHFFGALEIEGFMEVNEFKARIDEWIDVLRKTKPVEGKEAVLIPGDPERQEESARKKEGIPLSEKVIEELKTISDQTGVPFVTPG